MGHDAVAHITNVATAVAIVNPAGAVGKTAQIVGYVGTGAEVVVTGPSAAVPQLVGDRAANRMQKFGFSKQTSTRVGAAIGWLLGESK